MALLVDRWAKPFLMAILLAAWLGAAFHWSHGSAQALMVAVAVLVVTCPCALSLATPAAMLASAGALARSGVLVRNLQALQAVAEVDTVVFDKTGTLTRDALALTDVRTRDGVSRAQALQWAGAMARLSLHPVSRAIHLAARTKQSQEGEGAGAADELLCDSQELAGQGVQARWTAPTERGPQGMLRWDSAAFCNVPWLQPASTRWAGSRSSRRLFAPCGPCCIYRPSCWAACCCGKVANRCGWKLQPNNCGNRFAFGVFALVTQRLW